MNVMFKQDLFTNTFHKESNIRQELNEIFNFNKNENDNENDNKNDNKNDNEKDNESQYYKYKERVIIKSKL